MDEDNANQTARGGGITPVRPAKTDMDKAKEYREQMLEALAKVTENVNKARMEDKLNIAFQYSGPDAFGRQSLATLEISKKLC